ncbi:hypothetical protein CAMGR0001_2116 [Campylobacter gracilis RM3268]|uniref:Uncharacterized protein n=1 Tax=Campylobacter gracilis RM3268 TaxID=553220 RepID=C8PFF9_9BACT|nr:hypothetical protein CAMGR0001_2116 [Campylobacter gracilis RM3268]
MAGSTYCDDLFVVFVCAVASKFHVMSFDARSLGANLTHRVFVG